ncbi:MAG: hypothetical protein WA160_05255 [Pseudobdellovibrio sp.]
MKIFTLILITLLSLNAFSDECESEDISCTNIKSDGGGTMALGASECPDGRCKQFETAGGDLLSSTKRVDRGSSSPAPSLVPDTSTPGKKNR